jgi:putative transposase
MGVDQTADPASASWRAASDDEYALGRGGDPLYRLERLPMAHAAGRFSAGFDSARLFLCLARDRTVAEHQPASGDGGAGNRGTGGATDGRDYRQPKRSDGAPHVLKAIRRRFPWLRHIFADGGYAGAKLRRAMSGHGDWTIEIVKRSDHAKGFVVLPKRWVVERTFAWLGRCRRLAKDWEKSIESATAWAQITSIRMLIRRIARYWIYE